MNKAEIIIYKADDDSNVLEVHIEDETVWLTQAQMAELFQTTRNNVTLHISNVFKEKELEEISVCKDSLLTAKEEKNTKQNFIILMLLFLLPIELNDER